MMADINEQITRIKSKLDSARQYETDFRAYGSETHKYILNPPAEYSLIKAFEDKFQVSLPDEYVGYLTQMGNGGAGPHRGVEPLRLDIRDDWAAGYSNPFKLHQQLKPQYPENPPEPIAKDEWAEMLNGLHYIGEFGYTITCLVVRGEKRGRIVYVDEERRCAPNLAKEHSFLEWYETWISGVNDGSLLPKRQLNL